MFHRAIRRLWIETGKMSCVNLALNHIDGPNASAFFNQQRRMPVLLKRIVIGCSIGSPYLDKLDEVNLLEICVVGTGQRPESRRIHREYFVYAATRLRHQAFI